MVNIICAMLDMNISHECLLSALIFTRQAYNHSKKLIKDIGLLQQNNLLHTLYDEQKQIQQLYLAILKDCHHQEIEINVFNLTFLESNSELQVFEREVVRNYITQLHSHIQHSSDKLQYRMLVHLNNVIDLLNFDHFYQNYILDQEYQLSQQPYFQIINQMTAHELTHFIANKTY